MYLDDRSWFCSRQSTCLLIAKASGAEAEKLGLDEFKNKAEFAVVPLRLVRSLLRPFGLQTYLDKWSPALYTPGWLPPLFCKSPLV